MKKILTIIFMTLVVLTNQSCKKEFDDLNNRIDSLEQRMSSLETVVNAYKNNLYVKSVMKTTYGHIIVFSDNSVVEVHENDTWIDSINIGDNSVDFVLDDGRTFSIPLYSMLDIKFDEDDLVVMSANSTRKIHYTVSSVIPDVIVEVFSSTDIEARVVSSSTTTGVIEVKTGPVVNEYSKVVVLVSNGEKVIMRRFLFELPGIRVEENNMKYVDAGGGEVELEFLSNIGFDVEVPASSRSWVSVVPDTRVMEKHTVKLKVEENNGALRETIVFVKSTEGNLSVEYVIRQQEDLDFHLVRVKEILTEFYYAMNGDNWPSKDYWFSEEFPFNWWCGVYFGDDGYLSELRLFENNLKGTIPEDFGLISDSPDFECWLSDNNLTGKIPESILQSRWWGKSWPIIIKGNNFDLNGVEVPPIRDFSWTTIDGEHIDNSVFKQNKYTILFKWYEGFRESIKYTPVINELYKRYKNHGLEVLGFTIGENINATKEFIEKYGIEFKNTMTNRHTENDELIYSPDYDLDDILVVDSDGNVVFDGHGYTGYTFDDVYDFIYDRLGTGDYYESADYGMDGKYYTKYRATEGPGLNFVLIGDAFSDRLIADGTYDKIMDKAAEALFDEEPYKTFRNMFNVHVVYAVSRYEKYYDVHGDTALGGYFGEGTFVGGDNSTVMRYARNVLTDEEMNEATIVVIMNSRTYYGTCWMYRNGYSDYGRGLTIPWCAMDYTDEGMCRTIHHEALGHGFGKLGDEYDYTDRIPSSLASAYKSEYRSYGWWKNVDFTSNPQEVHWNYFLNDPRYKDEELGVYEGGLTYSYGVWRPSRISIMRHNTGGFNAPSREAIYYRIHRLVYGENWKYDYEDFVKYDEINRNVATRSYELQITDDRPRLAEPVVVDKSWKEVLGEE